MTLVFACLPEHNEHIYEYIPFQFLLLSRSHPLTRVQGARSTIHPCHAIAGACLETATQTYIIHSAVVDSRSIFTGDPLFFGELRKTVA